MDPNTTGMTGPEQLVRRVLTLEHTALVDQLITAFTAGDMDAYDQVMAELAAEIDPDFADIIAAVQMYTLARAADTDTAAAYQQFAVSRFSNRTLTAASIIGVLGIGLRAGQLRAVDYDFLVYGLREWTGWSDEVAAPMVEAEVATEWLAAIRRAEP